LPSASRRDIHLKKRYDLQRPVVRQTARLILRVPPDSRIFETFSDKSPCIQLIEPITDEAAE
jgi:hypothetical protein